MEKEQQQIEDAQEPSIDLSGKRWCVYVDYGSKVEGGYIPSVVIADEAGHSPLSGRGEHASPWVWGPSYDDAMRAATAYNRRRGMTDVEVSEIIASSMVASMRGRRAVR